MDKTSNKKADRIDNRRRNFLKMAAAGAPAVATVALSAGAAEADPALKGGKDGEYQETAHIRTYYETARF